MSKSKLQIRFGGPSHQIDANTLINSLIFYNAVVAEINGEMTGGSRNVKVSVNALKQGSFVLDLELGETLKTIFSNETVQYLSGIVTVFGCVMSTYSKFKGKPVAENQKDEVAVNIKDSKLKNVTINVYNNRYVRESISKSIENVNQDNSVESIEFSAKEFDEPVCIPRESFTDLIYNDFDLEEVRPQEIDEYVDATLVITGLKFEKGGTWSFIYNGFPIKMIVKDDALMQEIDNGARFGKGDSIEVKMKIVKKYVPEYKSYTNKSFKIVEFHKHVKYENPTQITLEV